MPRSFLKASEPLSPNSTLIQGSTLHYLSGRSCPAQALRPTDDREECCSPQCRIRLSPLVGCRPLREGLDHPKVYGEAIASWPSGLECSAAGLIMVPWVYLFGGRNADECFEGFHPTMNRDFTSCACLSTFTVHIIKTAASRNDVPITVSPSIAA